MTKQKGNNRFTDSLSSEEKVNQIDNNDIILKILKDEFPDDVFYAKNSLSPDSPAAQARGVFKKVQKPFPAAERNTQNVLHISTEKDEYSKYDLAKTFPTIDDDVLDDLIEEEWEYFEKGEPTVIVQPVKDSGLFLVNADVDIGDMHDLYIDGGPHNIDEEDDIANSVFCVFYIDNGTAYAIPTYKTLEVMLVERGTSYSIIKEATTDQIKDFDLLIDGETSDDVDYGGVDLDQDDDDDVTPAEEFRARSLPTRDGEWNYSIRHRSGYLPKSPFLRDPGDYIKPETARNADGRKGEDENGDPIVDIWVKEDPNDRYFDQVFQKQTFREMLREDFEGKMIIADWPSPDYISSQVSQGTSISSDDAVLNLRIMINGHWKAVTQGPVMKLYAYLNDFDISDYEDDPAQGRYGEQGYIQLLIDAGGITVVQPNGGRDARNDAQQGGSDLDKKTEPLWGAFPHIVDADDDNISGVDIAEYREYLDNFSNGGDPFGIEYLQPYEPGGSIKYYPEKQYQDLIAQAIQQEQIDAIKELIWEIWPGIAAKVTNTKIQFDSLPADYCQYVTDKLGPSSPLYNVMMSKNGDWKYIKRKPLVGRDKILTKASSKRLFKICSQKIGIRQSLSNTQEDRLVSNWKWMKTVKREKFKTWSTGHRPGIARNIPVRRGHGASLSNLFGIQQTRLASSMFGRAFAAPKFGAFIGSMVTNPMSLIKGRASVIELLMANKLLSQVPADEYSFPPWEFVDDNWYLTACILNEIDEDVEGFKQAADAADTSIDFASKIIDDVYDDLGEVDYRMLHADSVEEFQTLYEELLEMEALCDGVNDDGLYSLGNNLRTAIDGFLRDQLKRQYNAIQYLRKRVYEDGNEWKRSKRYGIVWPKGPQDIMNSYVPGCKFDNFLPNKNLPGNRA
mgnify:CR=1 FL=1